MAQDLPPVGGYDPIQWKRNLPSRGFRPSIWLAGVVGICTYGFVKVIQGVHERNELARERVWSRIYLQPVLEAEADRDAVRRHFARVAREKEIMSNVEGWDAEASVYNDKRFRNPTYVASPRIGS